MGGVFFFAEGEMKYQNFGILTIIAGFIMFLSACGNEPIVIEPGETSFRVAGGANVASDLVNGQSIFGQQGDGPGKNNTNPPDVDILKECTLEANQSLELSVVGASKRSVSINSSMNLSVRAKVSTLNDKGEVDRTEYVSGVVWTIVRGPSENNNASIAPELNTEATYSMNTTTFSSGTGISKYYVNAFHACAKQPASFTIEVTKPASLDDGGLKEGDPGVNNDTTAPPELGKVDESLKGKNLELLAAGGTSLMVYAKDSVEIGGFFLVDNVGQAGAEIAWKLVKAGLSDGATIAGSTKASGKLSTEDGGYFNVKFDAGKLYNQQYYLNFYHANIASRPLVIAIKVIALPAKGDGPGSTLGGDKPAATIDKDGKITTSSGTVISLGDLLGDKELKDQDGNPIKVEDTHLEKDKNGNWVLVDKEGRPVYADLDGDGTLDPVVIVVDETGGITGYDLDGDAKADIPLDPRVVAPPGIPKPDPSNIKYEINCLGADGVSWTTNCGLRRVPADSHLMLKFRLKEKGSSFFITSKNVGAEKLVKFKVVKGADPNNDGGIWKDDKAVEAAEGKISSAGVVNPDGSTSPDLNGILTLDFYAGNGFSSTYYVYAGNDESSPVMVPVTVSFISNDMTIGGDKPDQNDPKPPITLGTYNSSLGDLAFVVLGDTLLKTPTARTLYLDFVLVKNVNAASGKPCVQEYASSSECWVPYQKVQWTLVRGPSTSNNASIGSSLTTSNGKSETRNRFYSGTAYDALYYVNAFHPNVLTTPGGPADKSKNPPKPLTYTINVERYTGGGGTCDGCVDPDTGDSAAVLCEKITLACKDIASAECTTFAKDSLGCTLSDTSCKTKVQNKLKDCSTDSTSGSVDGPDGACTFSLSLVGEQNRVVATNTEDKIRLKLSYAVCDNTALNGKAVADKDIHLYSVGALPKDVNNGFVKVKSMTTNSAGEATASFYAGSAAGASYRVLASYPGKVTSKDDVDPLVFDIANTAKVSVFYSTVYTGDTTLDAGKKQSLKAIATQSGAMSEAINTVDFYLMASMHQKCSTDFVDKPSLFDTVPTPKASITGVNKDAESYTATFSSPEHSVDLEKQLTVYAIAKDAQNTVVGYGCLDYQSYVQANNKAQDPAAEELFEVQLVLNERPMKAEGEYDVNVLLDLGGFLDESTTLGGEIAKIQQVFAKFAAEVNGEALVGHFITYIKSPTCGNAISPSICKKAEGLLDKPFVKKLLILGIDLVLKKITGGGDPQIAACKLVDGIQFIELSGKINLKDIAGVMSGDFIVSGVNIAGTRLDSNLPLIKGRMSGVKVEGGGAMSIDQFALNFAYGELVYEMLSKAMGLKDGQGDLLGFIDCKTLFPNGIPFLGISAEGVEKICGEARNKLGAYIFNFAASKYIAVNVSLAGSATLKRGAGTSDVYADLIENGKWDGTGTIGGGQQVVKGLWVGLRKAGAANNSDCGSCTMPEYKDRDAFVGDNSVCRRKVKETPQTPETTTKDCLMGTYEVAGRKTNNLCSEASCQMDAIPFCKKATDGSWAFNGSYTNTSEEVIKLVANYICKTKQGATGCTSNPDLYASPSNMAAFLDKTAGCEGVNSTAVAACLNPLPAECSAIGDNTALIAAIENYLGFQTNSPDRLATNLGLTKDDLVKLAQIRCLQIASEAACKTHCKDDPPHDECLGAPEFMACTM